MKNIAMLPKFTKKVGFQYFPDTHHYRESDLKIWLPELILLNASWIVLKSSINRAVPETFISNLINAGIEPIIHFDIPVDADFEVSEIETLLQVYKQWGVKYIMLFNTPNNISSWAGKDWSNFEPVNTFTNIFIQFAEWCIRNDISPVYPPLYQGGNYWDTIFLKSSLGQIKESCNEETISQIVLSANSWTWEHDLSWGKGGSEKWPETRPYATPQESQDQRGFHVFDWYNEISESIFDNQLPIILMDTGIPSDPSLVEDKDTFKNIFSTNFQNLFENLDNSSNSTESIQLPENILGINFFRLSTSKNHPEADLSLFSESGSPNYKIISEIKQSVINFNQNLTEPATKGNSISHLHDEKMDFAKPGIFKDNANKSGSSKTQVSVTKPEKTAASPQKLEYGPAEVIEKPVQTVVRNSTPKQERNSQKNYQIPQLINHYLLLPVRESENWLTNIDGLKPFLQKYKPTIGHSLREAVLAKYVTVIGNEQVIPEETLNRLRDAGCKVHRIH